MSAPNKHLILSKVDVEVLRLAYDYDGLSSDLFLKAMFPKPSARSYGYTRISRLAQSGLLNRTRLPSLTGIGSGQSFFTLGREGRKVMASLWDIPRTDLIRKETPISILFVAHHLFICTIRLNITQATQPPNSGAEIIEWRTERQLRAQAIKGNRQRHANHILIPDAYFTLAAPSGQHASFCLEADMGTLSRRRWAEKLSLYNKSEHRAILVVVPNEKRDRELVELTLEVAKKSHIDTTRFWYANIQHLSASHILSQPVWTVAGVGPTTLLPHVSTNSSLSFSSTLKTAPPTQDHIRLPGPMENNKP